MTRTGSTRRIVLVLAALAAGLGIGLYFAWPFFPAGDGGRGGVPGGVEEQPPRGRQKVLFFADSYSASSMRWPETVFNGFTEEMARHGYLRGRDYRAVRDSMDAAAKSSREEKAAEGARILRRIRELKPDLVVTSDDDALVHVGLKVGSIPVVFNGVNGSPAKYCADSGLLDSLERPGHNVTGVYQTTYFAQSLALIARLRPGARSFAVICDGDVTGRALLGDLEARKDLPLEWKETFVSRNFEEWKPKIREWQGKVDCLYVLCSGSARDGRGRFLGHHPTVAWIAKNARMPTTGNWDFQVKDGLLVSAADTGEQQGLYAARLAVEILRGRKAGELHLITPPDGVPVINMKTAGRLGIRVPQKMVNMFIEDGRVYK